MTKNNIDTFQKVEYSEATETKRKFHRQIGGKITMKKRILAMLLVSAMGGCNSSWMWRKCKLFAKAGLPDKAAPAPVPETAPQ